MKEILVPGDVIYDIEEDWLNDIDERLERPAFWIWVKDMSGLDEWRFNFEQEHFHCDIRDKKKAAWFILRYL